MSISELQNLDISKLEKRLLKNGKLIPISYYELNNDYTQEQISLFCHKHAIYQILTLELLDFLKNEIGDDCIEIGSGNGAIGNALNIPMYDNFMQERADIKLTYAMMGQPTIVYGDNIINLAANEAVKKVKPKTVLGCWVTQLYKEGISENGNMYGIDEIEIFEQIDKYILVGNEKTHGNKDLFKKYKPKEYQPHWLISRSMSRSLNKIYILDKKLL